MGGDARLFFCQLHIKFNSSKCHPPCLRSHLSCHRRCCSSCFILPFPRITKFEPGYGSYGSSSGYGQAYGQYARSNDNAPWEGINILQWIQVLQDMYQNFDYNDLDCQKRMICEVMKEPEYYGSVARKFKNGFQYAKYLELMNLPDEMRELLDEYLDAN